MIYLNMKTSHGTETVDELNRNDFNTFKEYKQELKRLINEYRIAGFNIYKSQRSSNEWRNK